MSLAAFPFSLADIKYWVIKRKDGVVIRYNLTPRESSTMLASKPSTALASSNSYYNYTPSPAYQSARTFGVVGCSHTPSLSLPLFSTPKVSLYVANAGGARKVRGEPDIILDCGAIFFTSSRAVLEGDQALVSTLLPYLDPPTTRIVSVAWDDRAAPPLPPRFWPAFLDAVGEGSIVTACQGGHGRSGTAFVCLLMCLNPEYDAAAAILHLRALHCARAIESAKQHAYIDEVAEELGRKGNSDSLHGLTSYREAFKALTLKSAAPYQARLSTLKETEKKRDEEWGD